MKASLWILSLLIAHVAACADVTPAPKKLFGLAPEEFYSPFLFRVIVACPEVLLQSTDSQGVDLKILSPREKIKAVIQFFLRPGGSMTYHYEERHVGDCNKGFSKITRSDYEGHYCYRVESAINSGGSWSVTDDGSFTAEGIGRGRADFQKDKRYIAFTYDTDLTTPGLKGQATYLVPVTKPLIVEDKAAICH